jgi:hypothetical protein
MDAGDSRHRDLRSAKHGRTNGKLCCPFRSRSVVSEGPERGQREERMLVGSDTRHADYVAHDSGCVDDVRRPCSRRLAIGTSEQPAIRRLRIAEQRHRERVLAGEGVLLFGSVVAGAVDHGAELRELRQERVEAVGLERSTRRIGFGIEEQHPVAADEVRRVQLLSVAVGVHRRQRESRQRVAGLDVAGSCVHRRSVKGEG